MRSSRRRRSVTPAHRRRVLHRYRVRRFVRYVERLADGLETTEQRKTLYSAVRGFVRYTPRQRWYREAKAAAALIKVLS